MALTRLVCVVAALLPYLLQDAQTARLVFVCGRCICRANQISREINDDVWVDEMDCSATDLDRPPFTPPDFRVEVLIMAGTPFCTVSELSNYYGEEELFDSPFDLVVCDNEGEFIKKVYIYIYFFFFFFHFLCTCMF